MGDNNILLGSLLFSVITRQRHLGQVFDTVAAAPPPLALACVVSLCCVPCLLQDIRAYRGPWPQRVYVGMGGKEYSGVRGGRGREHDAYFPRYLKALYAALTEQGLGPDRLAWSYDPRATHNESAWAARLPDALGFIGQGWWASWLQRQAASGRRLLASAPQLCAGVEGQLLFFNRSASPALAHLPRGSGLKVTLGVDGWQGAQQLQLEPLGAAGPHHHVEPPAALQQEVFEAWGLDPSLQQTLHKRLLDSVRGTGSSSSSGPAPDDWYVLQLPPPPAGCHQLDMAFCGKCCGEVVHGRRRRGSFNDWCCLSCSSSSSRPGPATPLHVPAPAQARRRSVPVAFSG